jgi:hypothetical protein
MGRKTFPKRPFRPVVDGIITLPDNIDLKLRSNPEGRFAIIE